MIATMTQPAKTRSQEAIARATFLGPCEVVAAVASTVRVRMPDGKEEAAELALAFPYKAVKGDLLLVIGGATGHWVIGVIKGQGKASLEFQGDVELRSIGGKVEIAADKGIEMRSKTIDIGAEKIKVVAEAVTETVTTLFTRVRDMMTVQAGEARQLVRGNWFSQSKRAQVQTEDAIAINGKQIHLG
jgi:hypothetical protein